MHYWIPAFAGMTVYRLSGPELRNPGCLQIDRLVGNHTGGTCFRQRPDTCHRPWFRPCRAVTRPHSREEATKSAADLKAKGMTLNEISPQEVGRMRQKLTRVNAAISVYVSMEL